MSTMDKTAGYFWGCLQIDNTWFCKRSYSFDEANNYAWTYGKTTYPTRLIPGRTYLPWISESILWLKLLPTLKTQK